MLGWESTEVVSALCKFAPGWGKENPLHQSVRPVYKYIYCFENHKNFKLICYLFK